VLNHPSPDYTFHGISELWFDDVETARAAAWDPGHQAIMKDMGTVADPARTVSLLIRLNFEKNKASNEEGGWAEKVPTPA
jgi:hypothetical protein